MIDALGTYLLRQVLPRRARIFATSHPYIALASALFYVLKGMAVGLPPLSVDALCTLAVSYDTVIFGFCVAAIALAIAIPNAKFLDFISKTRSGGNPYKDLVFVFSWTGIVHWVGFVCSVVTIIYFGKEALILIENAGIGRSMWFIFFLTVQIYAVLQLLVNLITAFEVADLYGTWLASSQNKSKDTPE